VTDKTDDLPLPGPQETLPPPVSLVVGLGASAGGIQALTQFFKHAPADAPIAYVVILHLSPDHESRLAEVLQRSTTLPVTQVRETVTLAPSHVYVIPPNSSLRVSSGSLVLSPQTQFEQRKAPVDIFFRTLADAYGEKAAAVVLSGTGSDGSSGLKRVKEYGGLTMVQDPDEAEHGEMPATALATGLVDYVLPVAEMPRRIVEYHERASESAAVPRGPSPREETEALRDIMTLLRARTGHDFSDYKPATIRRRIERRMTVHAVTSLAAYAEFLREQSNEAVALMKELLISVTNFFRDEEPFRFLEQRLIPRLFEGKTAGDQVRAWSVGCATGEEAYSIAMLLVEYASGLLGAPAIQVFATDLDETAIAAAREGVYSEADVTDVSPERLKRFFLRTGEGYRVRRELRELVLFAHHNVIRDPPFSHLDLIACRNVLIYLNRAIQERLMETFNFALRAEGYLFLGTSESTDERSDLFVAVDKGSRIYQCKPTRGRHHAPLPTAPRVAVPPSVRREGKSAERIPPGDLHLRLLEELAPPSLVVGDDHGLVHASDRAAEFLHLTGGEPSRDVLKLIRPELRADLRTALHMAAKERKRVEVRGARIDRPEGDAVVTVVVKPVLREGTVRGYFLVLFEEEGAEPLPADAGVRIDTHRDTESEELQDELSLLKAQLRTTIEESDTQVEDAKATNEELQAINEELRSSTEELETSKEELQSSNEELATVNQELKIKIEELALSNNDFRNLINSTEIGAIFLDRSLRVKLSTPRAQDVFNLQASDAGRRLSDITHRLRYPELYDDVDRVLRDLQTIEREVSSLDQRWFLVRVMPYRTSDDRIEGVALTFHDITSRRAAEEDVRSSEERLRLLIESAADYAIFTMDTEGIINSWNPGAERVFGFKADEITGVDFGMLFTPEDRVAGLPQQELARAVSVGRAEDERWHLRKSGDRFYASGVTTRLGKGEMRGFVKIARDLTERRKHEMALDEARAQLELRVQQRTAELQAEVEQHEAARQQVTTLLRKIVTAQEDERTRIARDLHDQLGQQLTALRLTLERHLVDCPVSRREDLDRALALARDLDNEVDFLAWELRPAALDDLGLAAALPRYVEQWSSHYGIQAQFETTGQLSGLRPEAEVAFYRVAQEALNNVLKHAHASRVDVLLESREGSIVLVVEDDGVGFDPGDPAVNAKGIGLMGVRERAALIGGTAQVESAPGKGTTVFFRCPVGECEAAT
jgi:two-component system CheB/CheR fusion protein